MELKRAWVVFMLGASFLLGALLFSAPAQASSGSVLLDRSLNAGKRSPLLPYWHHYPWRKVSEAKQWTSFLVKNIPTQAPELLKTAPRDADLFCPRYSGLDQEQKILFWARFVSILAEMESSYDPKSIYKDVKVGPDVLSSGLLMLSLQSVKYPVYKCDMIRGQKDLLSPQRNFACALRIMNRLYSENPVISGNTGTTKAGQWQGLAEYWGPLRSKQMRTSSNRQAFRKLADRKRASWYAQGKAANHPAQMDSLYRKSGESKFEKLARLMNQMPFCQ